MNIGAAYDIFRISGGKNRRGDADNLAAICDCLENVAFRAVLEAVERRDMSGPIGN
jgi:hypothetical protein